MYRMYSTPDLKWRVASAMGHRHHRPKLFVAVDPDNRPSLFFGWWRRHQHIPRFRPYLQISGDLVARGAAEALKEWERADAGAPQGRGSLRACKGGVLLRAA